MTANKTNASRNISNQIENGCIYPLLKTLGEIIISLGISLSDSIKPKTMGTDKNDFVVIADKGLILDLPDIKNTWHPLSKTVFQNIVNNTFYLHLYQYAF